MKRLQSHLLSTSLRDPYSFCTPVIVRISQTTYRNASAIYTVYKQTWGYVHRQTLCDTFSHCIHTHTHIHTLTFRLISPCRASRYSYISVQSEKGSCRQFSLNLRISILSWKPLFTGGCAASPPPPTLPSLTRIKLNIAKAKQQCITTLCDIYEIREIKQTK